MHSTMRTVVANFVRHILLIAAGLVLLAACVGGGFPDDAEVSRDFMSLASKRLPAGVKFTLVDTYRGDGDDNSFSQVFVFDIDPGSKASAQEGWLKEKASLSGDGAKRRKVELIYRKENGQWKVVDDGPI